MLDKRLKFFTFALLLALYCLTLPILANSIYRLFTDKREQVINYDLKIDTLKSDLKNPQAEKPSVVLQVNGQQEKYTVLKLLGEGNTTTIFQVVDSNKNVFALRLPKKYGNFTLKNQTHPYSWFISEFYEGADFFKGKSLAPAVHSKKGSPFVLVEVIDHQDIFEDWFTKADVVTFFTNCLDNKKFRDGCFPDKNENKKKLDKLLELAGELAEVEQIGDFHPGQLVWSKEKEKWMILDWVGSGNKVLRFDIVAKHEDPLKLLKSIANPFQSFSFFPKTITNADNLDLALYKQIHKKITDVRIARAKEYSADAKNKLAALSEQMGVLERTITICTKK